MTTVHIFSAPLEPATRFNIGAPVGKRQMIHWPARKLVAASCCWKRRWAGNCVMQVYYDALRFSCRKGKGCKS